MAGDPGGAGLIEAINDLAMEIARLCPDAADRAKQIVVLTSQLKPPELDRGAIQDTLASQTLDSDVSDAQVRTVTEAVVSASRP